MEESTLTVLVVVDQHITYVIMIVKRTNCGTVVLCFWPIFFSFLFFSKKKIVLLAKNDSIQWLWAVSNFNVNHKYNCSHSLVFSHTPIDRKSVCLNVISLYALIRYSRIFLPPVPVFHFSRYILKCHRIEKPPAQPILHDFNNHKKTRCQKEQVARPSCIIFENSENTEPCSGLSLQITLLLCTRMQSSLGF